MSDKQQRVKIPVGIAPSHRALPSARYSLQGIDCGKPVIIGGRVWVGETSISNEGA